MVKQKCSVPNCEDVDSKRHRFPHPISDFYKRFNKWLTLVGNPILLELDVMAIYRNKRVCGRHFSENLYIPRQNKLKRNACPDINLPRSLDSFQEEGRELQPEPSGLQTSLTRIKVSEVGSSSPAYQDITPSSANQEWSVLPAYQGGVHPKHQESSLPSEIQGNPAHPSSEHRGCLPLPEQQGNCPPEHQKSPSLENWEKHPLSFLFGTQVQTPLASIDGLSQRREPQLDSLQQQITEIQTDQLTPNSSNSPKICSEEHQNWDSLRVLDLLPNLPSDIEILRLCITLKNLRSSPSFKPCNIEEIDTLLTIASYWKKLIPEIRTLIFNRIRYLALVAKYGWER